MNDIIVAYLENDYRNVDSKNLVMWTNNTSQSLLASSKQPPSIPVKTTTIKTKSNE
jgi:hypothetical protein